MSNVLLVGHRRACWHRCVRTHGVCWTGSVRGGGSSSLATAAHPGMRTHCPFACGGGAAHPRQTVDAGSCAGGRGQGQPGQIIDPRRDSAPSGHVYLQYGPE